MRKQWATIRDPRATISLALLGVLLIGVSTTNTLPVKLVWNASSSVPIGLYAIRQQIPSRGDFVLVQLPEWASLVADRRGYLPANVPALKRVLALAGDRVCRVGSMITVNEKAIAWAWLTDNLARKLPGWQGCLTLEPGQVFLLANHRNSFDGRYFGVTKLDGMLGVAKAIWVGPE